MGTRVLSQWDKLLPIAFDLIDQVNRDHDIIDQWTFGGGTALMLQIDHRESHDIDIFIDDPQLLGFLDPAKNSFNFSMLPNTYDGDGTGHIKLAFDDIGEIDFIVAQRQTTPGFIARPILGRDVLLETPQEIIAKKVVYRGANIQPRDIFDIAATLRVLGHEPVTSALFDHQAAVNATARAVNNMNAEFASKIISGLSIMPMFEDLASDAYRHVQELFETLSQVEHH